MIFIGGIMSILFKNCAKIPIIMALRGKTMNEELVKDICLYIDDNINENLTIDEIAL